MAQFTKLTSKFIDYVLDNQGIFENNIFCDRAHAESRMIQLSINKNIVLTVDCDFPLDEMGELLKIMDRFLREEQIFVWSDLLIKFR